MLFFIIALLIPLLVQLVLVLCGFWSFEDKRKVTLSAGVGIAISSIICILAYFISVSKTNFNEIGNFKIISLKYEEKWTTKESYTVEVYDHTDEDGTTHYRTETRYRTDEHGPFWTACDEYSDSHSISPNEYNKWAMIWGQNKTGVHKGSSDGFDRAITGNIYEAKWNNRFEDIYPWEEIWQYKNKVRVSNSVFKWPEPSKNLKEKYPRPADQKNVSPIISYGPAIPESAILLLRQTNAYLGKSCQVHCMVLLFGPDRDRSVVDDVLSAWQGPNMNELAMFVGLDSDNQILWCDVQSWSDNTTIHSELRTKIVDMKQFDPVKLSQIWLSEIPNHWYRKDFKKDFGYIRVPISIWWFIVSIVLCAGSSVGLSYKIRKE